MNLKSTLDNVTQSIGQIPQADQASKQQLAALMEHLLAELEKAPADKAAELMDVAARPEANPKKVEQKANNLKKAAEDIKERPHGDEFAVLLNCAQSIGL